MTQGRGPSFYDRPAWHGPAKLFAWVAGGWLVALPIRHAAPSFDAGYVAGAIVLIVAAVVMNGRRA